MHVCPQPKLGLRGTLGLAGVTTPCILSRPQLCSDLFQICRAGSLGWSLGRVRPTLSHLINYVHNDPRNDFGQPCDHRPCAIGHTCVRISTTFGIQVPLGIRPTLTHVIRYGHAYWFCVNLRLSNHRLSSLCNSLARICSKLCMQVPLSSDSEDFYWSWHISLNMCIHNVQVKGA